MRGHGIGGQLLKALVERARAEGYPALSLSVERGNPAFALYERHGFQPLREAGDTVVMRAPLRPDPA